MGGWDRCTVVDLYQGVGGGIGGGFILQFVSFFTCTFVLSCAMSLFFK